MAGRHGSLEMAPGLPSLRDGKRVTPDARNPDQPVHTQTKSAASVRQSAAPRGHGVLLSVSAACGIRSPGSRRRTARHTLRRGLLPLRRDGNALSVCDHGRVHPACRAFRSGSAGRAGAADAGREPWLLWMDLPVWVVAGVAGSSRAWGFQEEIQPHRTVGPCATVSQIRGARRGDRTDVAHGRAGVPGLHYDPLLAFFHLGKGIDELKWAYLVLGIVLAGSLYIERFFCKYACPMEIGRAHG